MFCYFCLSEFALFQWGFFCFCFPKLWSRGIRPYHVNIVSVDRTFQMTMKMITSQYSAAIASVLMSLAVKLSGLELLWPFYSFCAWSCTFSLYGSRSVCFIYFFCLLLSPRTYSFRLLKCFFLKDNAVPAHLGRWNVTVCLCVNQVSV